MKKHFLSMLLCTFIAGICQAQYYELVSHLNGWGSTVNYCDKDYCPTFDLLCVTGTGCSGPVTGPTWKRIGTPSQPSNGYVFLHSSSSVEGLFTGFNWVPGETYYIHIGIRDFGKYTLAGAPTGSDDASIKLFATKQLVQTNGTDEPMPCCTEYSLWDYANNHFNNTTNYSGSDYWSDNNGQNNANVDGEEIGEIRPNTTWAGTTKTYTITYQPAFGTSFNQFAFQAYYEDPNSVGDQLQTVIDYVIIERDCGSGFGYTRMSNTPSTVTFFANNANPSTTYNWDFGDGNTGTGSNVSHTYGGFSASPKVCLNALDVEGHNCPRCADLCIGGIGHQNSCDVAGEFQLDVNIPQRLVGMTPTMGGGVNYVIDWGDGTSSSSPIPMSWLHTYTAPGGYTICQTIFWDETETCWSRTCVRVCFTEFDGSNISEDGIGEPEGKPGREETPEAEQSTGNFNQLLPGGIVIKPNPVTSDAIIELPAAKAGKSQVIVYDMMGKTVLKQDNQLIKGSNKISLDMSKLQNGMYIIEINSDGKITRSKIVKE